MQALVAASAGRWNERVELESAAAAISWLEGLAAPQIIAPVGHASDARCQFFVPDNTADLLVPAWKRGDANKQVKRAEKVVWPTLLESEAVHFVYALPNASCREQVEQLTKAARSITHLGWGVDMAVGDAKVLTSAESAELPGVRWMPSTYGGTPLRAPKAGTLDDLIRKHKDFLGRVSSDGFRPVPPLRVFDIVRYRRQDEPLCRPYRVFELRNLDGSRFRYPHRRLMHIAGMVRHLAIEAMKHNPPAGVDQDWVETYVAGHHGANANHHRQLSYLPLPSVGHPHADPGVRRVMIAAPVGDDTWLHHVARRLAGQLLKPDPDRPDPFAGREPPLLVPMSAQTRDGVVRRYTDPANIWHSFTPVILPGHDDHKQEKTRALIERALLQSGIDQPCDFEWSAFSRFAKSFSAHKYDRHNKSQGYFRPDYLSTLTAVHLTLKFKNDLNVPGPVAIGAGRHCGIGLFATEGTP
jgi:CRISPR-associated protein Csb2